MNFYSKTLPLLKDIRFWILLLCMLRLYGITFPPLEIGHNWRQTDGLMIARNFLEIDANIFFPRVDVAGDKTGIVGSEFPLLNYIIYLISLVFGYAHWYGRLIVLISSAVGTYYFYKLIKKYFGETVGFNASIILLGSLWFSYSRKIIPDVFAISLCIVSLFYAIAYLEQGKFKWLIIFFLLAVAGCLEKILAATVLTILVFHILDNKILLRRKVILTFSALLILGATCAWYFVWVPYLNSIYGFGDHFFMGMNYTDGFNEIINKWQPILKRFFSTPFKYVGFIIFLCSILISIKKKSWRPLTIFLIPFFVFIILLVKTGASIIGDHYYFITVIPCMAFIMGYGISLVNKRWVQIIILIAIVSENVGDQIYDFRIREPFRSLADLEDIMDSVSAKHDLIAINTEAHNPTPMYFSHRRGWTSPNSLLSNANYLQDLQSKGCKYVVIVKKIFGDLVLEYPIVYDSEYFKIYTIKKQ